MSFQTKNITSNFKTYTPETQAWVVFILEKIREGTVTEDDFIACV